VWRVEKRFDTGFHASQTETFTLRKLGETSADVDLTLNQTALSQPVDTPTVTPDTSITLQHFEGSGAGTLTIPFDRVAPLGRVTSDTDIQFLVETEGQKTVTTTKLHVELVTRDKE
jgi:hypothetical protein